MEDEQLRDVTLLRLLYESIGTASRRDYPCVLCNKRTKPQERRFLNGPGYKGLRRYLVKFYFIQVNENDVTCNKCRSMYYRETQNEVTKIPVNTETPFGAVKSPKNISLQIKSVGGSYSTCFVCKRRGPKLVVVPLSARNELFIDSNILIPAGARSCPLHISDASFTTDALTNILAREIQANTTFNRTDIMKLLQILRNDAKSNADKRIDFDGSSICNGDYKNLLGIDKDQFETLCGYIKSGSIRDTKVRSIKTCIGILLTKLRSGMSNKILSTVFNISKDAVKRAVNTARKALNKDFVPQHIGFQHISRDEIINNHTRPIAQTLFGDVGNNTAILVIDGTYIYIQKSTQARFQRRSYSMHKHRPLIKPMVFVSTTGYVISVLGPYLSDYKNNDANILKHTFENNIEQIRSWFEEEDVLIVDRGFRDSIELLEEVYGLKCQMPSFLCKGQKQMTTADGNASRLVTKVRWVVESFNGRLKQWKYLDRVIPNTQIPFVGEYVRLIAAISNKFLPPLSIAKNADEDIQIATRMIYLSKQRNELQEIVEREGLDRKNTIWKAVGDNEGAIDIKDFSRLSEEEIRGLTVGVYQLNMAKIYAQEHFDTHNGFELFVNNDDEHFLRAKLQSRHTSSRIYKVFIKYNEANVCAWYCTCRPGARVVGMCCHCTTIIWYLGYARYQDKQWQANKNWFDFVVDADKPLDDVDSSDDDTVSNPDITEEE